MQPPSRLPSPASITALRARGARSKPARAGRTGARLAASRAALAALLARAHRARLHDRGVDRIVEPRDRRSQPGLEQHAHGVPARLDVREREGREGTRRRHGMQAQLRARDHAQRALAADHQSGTMFGPSMRRCRLTTSPRAEHALEARRPCPRSCRRGPSTDRPRAPRSNRPGVEQRMLDGKWPMVKPWRWTSSSSVMPIAPEPTSIERRASRSMVQVAHRLQIHDEHALVRARRRRTRRCPRRTARAPRPRGARSVPARRRLRCWRGQTTAAGRCVGGLASSHVEQTPRPEVPRVGELDPVWSYSP